MAGRGEQYRLSDTTFDAAKNYKKVCYQADRDLLNTELNEAQDIEAHERRILLDKILAQGTIILGLTGTVDTDEVTIVDGVVYLDGYAVNVPGATLSLPAPGEHLIYLDVFRREVTASDDPSLVNPLTGEPTAEREKWIATLQTRDTTNDPLPNGAISRTVAPVYIFNRNTGELRPYVGSSLSGGDIFSAFANHVGHGGLDRHPAVTSEIVGFMTPDQAASLEFVEAALPNKAETSALNAHKTSADHDSRYYTETESDGRFAPVGHVGSGGNAHAAATTSQAGFMSASDKTELGNHESRIGAVESALPGKADDADVAAVTDALNTHKGPADHDSRYFTETESDGRFAPKAHVGSGGNAHSLATTSQAGFMDSSDKTQLGNHETRIVTVETALPNKASAVDLTAVQTSLNAHKTSGDHDARYLTLPQGDARYTPIAHVGAAGNAHGLATITQPGFLSKEFCWFMKNLIKWTGYYDYGNDHTGTLLHGTIAPAFGMIWRGKCDSGSAHMLTANLRATGLPITAVFELYHLSGTVTMQTGGRTSLIDPVDHPSTVPGSKVYYVQLYPDSFTCVVINATGSSDVGFSLNIFPGDDRQICWDFDSNTIGLPLST